jgi:Icc-related predicted phosphoesterase
MRILACADVHGRPAVYQWLVATAREHGVEAILLAGDLLGCPDGFETPEEAQRYEAQTLTSLLEAAGVPVLYIMGNDDLVELDSRSTHVQSIHARRTTLGTFSFVGYQYSLPFMGGVFEKPEAGIETDLACLEHLVDSQTVFVSHSPALGILDPGFGESRIGSDALRRFLDRHPCLVHIHGHSHAGFGRVGRHLNVASAGQRRAVLVNLETMQHQVLGMELHGPEAG